MISTFDINNLQDILYHEKGDWYTAILLRALDKLLAKADENNQRVLISTWPAECVAIYRYNGWQDNDIAELLFDNYEGNVHNFLADQPHPKSKYDE
jgi:hypothetical protein